MPVIIIVELSLIIPVLATKKSIYNDELFQTSDSDNYLNAIHLNLLKLYLLAYTIAFFPTQHTQRETTTKLSQFNKISTANIQSQSTK